ncbi:MAG TPA: hypothetical protein VFQ53_26195 [Kofleriaceae bacterium]|nr:hypothetical protein [Kofleriaceae bacterium]
MAHIEPDRANDPGSSPGLAGLGELKALLPYALAFLANDGPDGSYQNLKRDLRKWSQDDPMDALLATVIGAGLAFYVAERDTNPGCKSPWDGILYMATALSVGYDNLFPTTTTGHALASLVQTFGPSLANAAFEPPAAEKQAKADEAAAVQLAILDRLDTIVRLLETKP